MCATPRTSRRTRKAAADELAVGKASKKASKKLKEAA